MTGIAEKAQWGLIRLPIALAACFALSASMLTAFPIVSSEVASELGFTYAEIGWVGAAYMLGYGLFQLPASLLAVRFGSSRVLTGAVVLMSIGALLPCLFSSFVGWLLSRFMMGVGGASVLPLSIHLLTQAMRGRRLVRALSIFISGWGVGMTLAMLGAVPVLRIWGWRGVLLTSAALGVVVLAGLWWALGDGARLDAPNGRGPVGLHQMVRPPISQSFAEHDGRCKRGGHHRSDLCSDLAPALPDEHARRVRFRRVNGNVADWSGRHDRRVGRRHPEHPPGMAESGGRLAHRLWSIGGVSLHPFERSTCCWDRDPRWVGGLVVCSSSPIALPDGRGRGFDRAWRRVFQYSRL